MIAENQEYEPFLRVRHGDCIEVMAGMPENSIDAIVTDPPYGLQFMGKEWDTLWRNKEGADAEWDKSHAENTDGLAVRRRKLPNLKSTGVQMQKWHTAWAKEALRVLKPGGHILAAGGSRTYHRLASAIEDAGFEVRDCVTWHHAVGFPKSHNLHGEWEGWGTALKPATEFFVLARKPLIGTVAANVLEHGVGALNIDGTRVGVEQRTYKGSGASDQRYSDSRAGLTDGRGAEMTFSASGRWPANVIFDEEMGALLDAQSGASSSTKGKSRSGVNGKGWGMTATGSEYSDSGGASRFFYCAKASKSERGEGNAHPTVKPLALMRYLCRLITPLGGVVLDPFAGSGTTLLAAHAEGFDSIGVEREAEYVAIIEARIVERTGS